MHHFNRSNEQTVRTWIKLYICFWEKWRIFVIILHIIMWIYNPFHLSLCDQEFLWNLIEHIVLMNGVQYWPSRIKWIKNDLTLVKWPYIFCCHYKFLPCTFGVYFCVNLYICKLPLMHISVHTYAQCAAVSTHRSLMREPPQKDPPLIMRATCHGIWPRAAVLPPMMRLACSFSGTWTFPANSTTHINTFECINRNRM